VVAVTFLASTLFGIVGAFWSRDVWSQGPGRFNLLWLWVGVVAAFGVVQFAKWGEKVRRGWLWVFVVSVLCLGLELGARSALRSFMVDLRKESLLAFAFYSSMFVITLVAWIVMFPSKEQITLRDFEGRIFAALGIAIACITLYVVADVIGHVNNRPDLSQLQELETRLRWISVSAFSFLGARILLPMSLVRLRTSSEGLGSHPTG
jgi:hypothetical protein